MLLDQLALPVEIVRTGDSIKFLSRPDAFPFLQRLRGVKKMEKLSPAALAARVVLRSVAAGLVAQQRWPGATLHEP